MSERNEAALPKEWRKITDYSLRIGWLHNQPKASQLELEQVMKEEGKEVSLEIIGHPGWWSYAHIMMGSFGSLDDALAAAKSTLKNSDFKPSVFILDESVPSSAPVKLSKSQRIKLIDEIVHEPTLKHEDLLREAFVQEGDYALSVWIEELSFREDFEAAFETLENPLRSFVGETVTVFTAPLGTDDDDLEDEVDMGEFEADDPEMEDMSEEEMVEVLGALEKMKDIDEAVEDANPDWKEVAKGVVRLEGNTLFVGEWQCVINNEELIYGAAFESASFDLKEKELSVLLEMENSDE
jgi:hypothetical protein